MVVETNEEVTELSIDALSIHVSTEVVAVGVNTISKGPVTSQANQVDVEVERAFLAKRIVQTRNNAQTNGGEVVIVVGGIVGHRVVSVAFQMKAEANLSFAEEGEVTPFSDIVTEIGVEADNRTVGGAVSILIAGIDSVIVVLETELYAKLHFVVQLIADFRHDSNIGAGIANDTSVIVIMSTIVSETHMATKNELCICGHCKSNESEGDKEFFHFLFSI